jgi:hypothetical protein
VEKLVWHSRTFEEAADVLLRLALAENESYANNATGTWLSLFGAALPATSASPDQRVTYLEGHSSSPDGDVRLLVARACAGHLHPFERVMVSGELQGGSFVEPRGGAQSVEEAGLYRRRLIALLDRLTADSDERVSKVAVDGLIAAILPLIDDPFASDALVDSICRLQAPALNQARQHLRHLEDVRNDTAESASVADALNRLERSLPPLGVLEQLRLLLDSEPWTLQNSQRHDELQSLVADAVAQEHLDEILAWLQGGQLPSGWHLGFALAQTAMAPNDQLLQQLIAAVNINLMALVGYLSAKVEAGDSDVFDAVLDGPLSTGLAPDQRLALTVRGPVTDRAKERALQLAAQLHPSAAASALFPLTGSLTVDDVIQLVHLWLPQINSQQDYNIVIDWLSLRLTIGKTPAELRSLVWELLSLRLRYPDMGTAAWGWMRLARIDVDESPARITQLVLDLITDEKLILTGEEEEEEAKLLAGAARASPESVWELVADRMEDGDWRVIMMLRKWFLASVSAEVIAEWIGDSADRARAVAAIADPGGDEPTKVARFLLERFGDDADIAAELASAYVSGVWWGPLSGRIAGQIAQLEGWIASSKETDGVKRWALGMIDGLRRQLEQALEREAEEQI